MNSEKLQSSGVVKMRLKEIDDGRNREDDIDIYSDDNRIDLMENDQLSAEEEAFMRGWSQADEMHIVDTEEEEEEM